MVVRVWHLDPGSKLKNKKWKKRKSRWFFKILKIFPFRSTCFFFLSHFFPCRRTCPTDQPTVEPKQTDHRRPIEADRAHRPNNPPSKVGAILLGAPVRKEGAILNVKKQSDHWGALAHWTICEIKERRKLGKAVHVNKFADKEEVERPAVTAHQRSPKKKRSDDRN